MAVGLFDKAQCDPMSFGYDVSGGTFEFYETNEARGHIGGCLVAATQLGPRSAGVSRAGLGGAWPPRMPTAITYDYAMAVLLILQDMPGGTNCVDLDPDVRDAWGLQVARITHKPHSNDVKMANWQMRKNVEILEAAGATSIVTTQLEQGASTMFHQHGTARMGKDANKAVLNEWCRAHDVTNLYVLDGSCFPTATGVPPMLAIMANAWRCAEHMLQVDAKGRN